MSKENNTEFAFNIKDHIGVISVYSTGWKKELNLVEWNGSNAKFDIRDWDPEHNHMSRGVTLRQEEAKALAGLIMKFLAQNNSEISQEPKDDDRSETPQDF